MDFFLIIKLDGRKLMFITLRMKVAAYEKFIPFAKIANILSRGRAASSQ